jgi:hypothetical protein
MHVAREIVNFMNFASLRGRCRAKSMPLGTLPPRGAAEALLPSTS